MKEVAVRSCERCPFISPSGWCSPGKFYPDSMLEPPPEACPLRRTSMLVRLAGRDDPRDSDAQELG